MGAISLSCIARSCRQVKTLLTKAARPIKYKVVRHAAVVTAAETAHVLGLPGCAVMKTVAVKVDGAAALCVLCSHQLLDLERLAKLAGASCVELATPRELREWFPGVEVHNAPLTPPTAAAACDGPDFGRSFAPCVSSYAALPGLG